MITLNTVYVYFMYLLPVKVFWHNLAKLFLVTRILSLTRFTLAADGVMPVMRGGGGGGAQYHVHRLPRVATMR